MGKVCSEIAKIPHIAAQDEIGVLFSLGVDYPTATAAHSGLILDPVTGTIAKRNASGESGVSQ